MIQEAIKNPDSFDEFSEFEHETIKISDADVEIDDQQMSLYQKRLMKKQRQKQKQQQQHQQNENQQSTNNYNTDNENVRITSLSTYSTQSDNDTENDENSNFPEISDNKKRGSMQRDSQDGILSKLTPWSGLDKEIAKQSKIKDFATSEHYGEPRTLGDLKNWDEKQNALTKLNKQTFANRIESEQLRENIDTVRSGHIINALQLSDQDAIDRLTSNELMTGKPGQKGIDFSTEPTYIEESITYLQYYTAKYGGPMLQGIGLTTFFGGLYLYFAIKNNYNNNESIYFQTNLIELLENYKPYNGKLIDLTLANNSHDLWYYLLTDYGLMPIIIISGIYAKLRGELWEYKQLTKEINKKERDKREQEKRERELDMEMKESGEIEIETENNIKNRKNNDYGSSSLVKSSKNRVGSTAHGELVWQIQLIKAKEKNRKKDLVKLRDVVDLRATLQHIRGDTPSSYNKSGIGSIMPKAIMSNVIQFKKFTKRYGTYDGLYYWMIRKKDDPRRLAPTQRYWMLQIQTRLDEHGRVIPGWQRESVTRFVFPCVAIFLAFPQIADWYLAWGL